MLPEIWGKYGWNFFHLVTVGYPVNPTDDIKKQYYEYIHALQYVLPCAKCRYNMGHHLKKYPLTEEILSNRTNLVRWGIDLHNVVNYYTGKPMLTYTEAMNEISKLINPPTKRNDVLYYLLIIIVIVIICYLLYYFFSRRSGTSKVVSGQMQKKLNF
jgi:preprotein translocase subunit SecE